jgi:hypothetical protein
MRAYSSKSFFMKVVASSALVAFSVLPLLSFPIHTKAAVDLSYSISRSTITIDEDGSDTQDFSITLDGELDAYSGYSVNLYRANYESCSEPENDFTDPGWSNITILDIENPGEMGDPYEMPVSLSYTWDVDGQNLQAGDNYVGIALLENGDIIESSTVSTFRAEIAGREAANCFNNDPSDEDVQAGSSLSLVATDTVSLQNPPEKARIDLNFEGKLLGDQNGDGFYCQIFISDYVSNIATTNFDDPFWVRESNEKFFISTPAVDQEYAKQCSYEWTVKIGEVNQGTNWLIGRIFDQNTGRTVFATNPKEIEVAPFEETSKIGLTFTGDKAQPGQTNPNMYFYEQKVNPVWAFNLHFQPTDTSISYKVQIGISWTGYDDASKSRTDDETQKWDIKEFSISKAELASGKVDWPSIMTKQFSKSTDPGYHQVFVKAFDNNSKLAYRTDRWIHVGQCYGNTACNSFSFTMKSAAGTAQDKFGKMMFDLKKPSPITFTNTFKAPTNDRQWKAVLQITAEGYPTWSETHTGDSSANWQAEADHLYPTNGNIDTYTFEKSFSTSSAKGYHEVNLKIYDGNDLYLTKSLWVFVGESTGGITPGRGDSLLNRIAGMGINNMNIEQLAMKTVFRWLPLMIGVGALVAIGYSGFLFITSRGEEKSAEKAKKGLSFAVVGMIIGTFALNIVAIALRILGFFSK